MRDYGFAQELDRSLSQREADTEAIVSHLGVAEVTATNPAEDKTGIDYWATLPGRRRVPIDVKRRTAGASTYWQGGVPELALEYLSVCEKNKAGWTLDGTKQTEYVLFTFDPADTLDTYMLPFISLRRMFRANARQLLIEYGRKMDGPGYAGTGHDWEIQSSDNGRWTSASVFVPAPRVIADTAAAMRAMLTPPPKPGPEPDPNWIDWGDNKNIEEIPF